MAEKKTAVTRVSTKGKVTRGFFYTEYTVLVVDKATASVSEATCTLSANSLTEEQLERKIQAQLGNDVKVVTIKSAITKGELRAMTEADFIKYSEVIRDLDESEKHIRIRKKAEAEEA